MIDDKVLFKLLNEAKKVLLFEPNYKRKYPPLGLMKLSTLAKLNGCEVEFTRQPKKTDADLICVTTLFTYDHKITIDAVKTLQVVNPKAKMIIGGVAASVRKKDFSIGGADVLSGYSEHLDLCYPDYSIDWMIDEKWIDWSFLFTTRGCPNSCGYCFVQKIEKELMVCKEWKKGIDISKRFAMVLDNNITAFGSDHINDVANYFEKYNIKCCLDNAVDCKYINTESAKALSKIPIVKRGIRTAFDRIAEDGIFQESIETLINSGISKYNIMAYVLFNYKDTPKEANYRAKECVKLGIAPYPARYKPINSLARNIRYVSPKWTDRLAISFNHFWLMAGYYRKYDFEEYAKGEGKSRYKLTDEDWSYWNEENVADSNGERLEGRSMSNGQSSRQLPFGESRETIQRKWESDPDVLRVAHGIPQRMDRIRSLGNAIVPQVVVPIMQAIKTIEEI